MKNIYQTIQTKSLSKMRSSNITAVVIILIVSIIGVEAQDLPVFSQKLTDSFISNPAVAGNGLGSVLLSYRNNFSGVEGAPSSSYLSAHTPFRKYRFGAGINVFQERSAAITTSYANAAFAYHLGITEASYLSFGIAGELNATRLSDDLVAQNNGDDLILSRYASNVMVPDFSFGSVLKTRRITAGLSANRLFTYWKGVDSVKKVASYLNGFFQIDIPIQEGDGAIQPYIGVRSYNNQFTVFDLGLYYSYEYLLMGGLSVRSNNVASLTAGYFLTRKLFAGYTREILLGNVGGYLGSSNEIVLRFNFIEKEKPRDLRSLYNRDASGMSFRKVKKMARQKTNEIFKPKKSPNK